jgi:hypothetical protein
VFGIMKIGFLAVKTAKYTQIIQDDAERPSGE